MSTVKSSSLPNNIKNEHHHLASIGKDSKLESGLTTPNPGPTLPSDVAEAPKAEIKSNPIAPSTPAPTIKSNI